MRKSSRTTMPRPMPVAMTTIFPPTRPRVCSRAYNLQGRGGGGGEGGRILLIDDLTITFVM